MNGNGRSLASHLDGFQRRALIVGLLGLAACLAGVFIDLDAFLHAWLWAYWFWLGVVIGSSQVLMLFHVTGGAWGFVIQRILEAATRTYPVMFLLSLPVVFGIPRIYRYADPAQVAMDKALQHKSLYLNTPFVVTRLAIYFAVWWVITYFLNRWSEEQDRTADFKYLNWRRNLSAPGIILYSVLVTYSVVDWVMALEPDWYSTMYPGFYLAGQVIAALAVAIIALRWLSDYEPLSGLTEKKVFQDLGNLTLAFLMLWAYFEVAQLMIQWSGNLPKEVTWYLHRTQGGWAWIAISIALFHFFVPFGIFLSRAMKSHKQVLAKLMLFLIIMRMVAYFWNFEPAFHPGQLYVHWLDFAAPIGIGGFWVFLMVWQLKKRPLVPQHDPRLVQALEKLR